MIITIGQRQQTVQDDDNNDDEQWVFLALSLTFFLVFCCCCCCCCFCLAWHARCHSDRRKNIGDYCVSLHIIAAACDVAYFVLLRCALCVVWVSVLRWTAISSCPFFFVHPWFNEVYKYLPIPIMRYWKNCVCVCGYVFLNNEAIRPNKLRSMRMFPRRRLRFERFLFNL